MLDHPVADRDINDRDTTGPEADVAPAAGTPDALLAHVDRLLRANRPAAARPLLNALKQRAAPAPAIVELEARLLLEEGRPPAALLLLDGAIPAMQAAEPASEPPSRDLISLFLLRAQIQVGLGNLVRAIDDTAHAVMLAPTQPEPKLRLGVLLIQLGRFDDAIACLREALAAQPTAAAFRGLALAFERSGRGGEAAATLAEAIRLWPKDYELRAAAVSLGLRSRDFAAAVITACDARRDGAINAGIFALLGHAYANLGRHADAAEAYRDAHKLAPDDTLYPILAAIAAAAAPPGTAADRLTPELARALFDALAPAYDQSMIAGNYRIPGLIRRELQPLLDPKLQPGPAVLDLGCGTGLVSLTIADLVGPITGFDISPAMLQAARMRAFFISLREGDLPDLLAATTALWPVIVAGDLLPAFGRLETLLALVCARLAPGGRFLFSAAMLRADADGVAPGDAAGGWTLGHGGRHRHSLAYILQSLQQAGLSALKVQEEILRADAEGSEPGWIIVAGHAGEIAEQGP